VCCGIARDANLDVCQPNGLCLNTGKNSFFRDFCTDKTWNSPNCLPRKTCSDGTDGQSFLEMTQCTDGTWCCGARNITDCCDKKLGFELKAELVTFNAKPVTVSITQSSLPTATEATIKATETLVQVVYRTKENSADSAKITGLTVGIILVGVLGSCAGYWLGRSKWRREKQDDEEPINLTINDGPWHDKPGFKPFPINKGPEHSINVYEVGSNPRFTELPAEIGSGK